MFIFMYCTRPSPPHRRTTRCALDSIYGLHLRRLQIGRVTRTYIYICICIYVYIYVLHSTIATASEDGTVRSI